MLLWKQRSFFRKNICDRDQVPTFSITNIFSFSQEILKTFKAPSYENNSECINSNLKNSNCNGLKCYKRSCQPLYLPTIYLRCKQIFLFFLLLRVTFHRSHRVFLWSPATKTSGRNASGQPETSTVLSFCD